MKSNVLQFPAWLSAEDAKTMIPELAWPLISLPDSLTEHLTKSPHQNVQLRLLSANWGSITLAERQALSLDPPERTWVRRIEFHHDNELWIHGRAIFPESTLTASGSQFPGLGVQSLGEVIFQDPNLQRSPFTYSLLNQDSLYYSLIPKIINSIAPIWARRSVLHFENLPILITELFTPASYAHRNT